jgi:thiamine-monophosphate kinase
MGAKPKYLLVAAAITEANNLEVVTELANGIKSVADKFEVAVIGGDLSKGEKMSISITAFGELNKNPILRSGAKVGDLVYVSALPGLSAAGLAILGRGLDRPRYVVEAHLNPKLTAPNELIAVANSMCDISDGVTTDGSNIAKASEVNIDLSKQLISNAAGFSDLKELADELGEDIFDWILSGGEDHFFFATVDPKNAKNELGVQIGVVKEGKGQVTLDGAIIQKAGYQHF